MSILSQTKTFVATAFIASLLMTMPVFGAGARSLTVGEGFVEPVGFYDAAPVFSWKLPEGVKGQTGYRIEAKSGNKSWDSGWVESEQSTLVPYKGQALGSRDAVEWRVNFRDENKKEGGWSERAHFELGLLSAKDWQGQWIRPSQESDPSKEPVAYLRRGFAVAKNIKQARIYVTARGVFEMRLNGSAVGQDHFANGWTDYDKRIDTLTYDVTKRLKRGENSLDVMLGSGWFAGRLPFNVTKTGPYGEHPELLLQLEVTFEDGSKETVVSDGKWEGTFEGPAVSSSYYDGESFDARKVAGEGGNWKPVRVNADLGAARLEPKPFPPVREVETLAVKGMSEPLPGHFVFDLGQNMVGWARVKVPVEKDQTVTIHFAEMLKPDGTLYTENYRSAKSTDAYTAASRGTVEWEPHFTFHGFRYVELTGVRAGAKPEKGWVTGVVMHSDLPTIGRFVSSHAKLNQLQSNINWSWWGNSVDIPTDCPQRDERAGWTGDAEVFCATAMFNTHAHSFWRSWLETMRDDQDANGVVPDIIPSAGPSGRRNMSPGWMDAATIIPWQVYVRTGDVRVLRENYGMMEKLVGWYRGQAVNGLLPNIKGYGDWLQPYQQTPPSATDRFADRRGDTPTTVLGVAFYARSAQILADTAGVLGKKEDAKRYGDEAAGVRAAFVKEYFDGNGKLKNSPDLQTPYVLAIAFDLLPAELKVKAGENLVRLVGEAGGHLRTGFLGTPHLAAALDATGHADVAVGLLFQETYPSWFYPINQGATTMWERWNSYTHENGFGDVAMNSFNHYAYGAIGQWMYERVAGLEPDAALPGYKHFFVRPLFAGPLNSASAELETPYGKAASAWVKKDGKVTLEVTVPPNTTATIEFPDGRAARTVGAGVYRFGG